MVAYPNEKAFSMGSPDIHRPSSITPAEHTALIGEAGARLLELTFSPAFQAAVRPHSSETAFSAHVIYPDQQDAVSELKRDAARKVCSYIFTRKDADTLDDYDQDQVAVLLTDNRFENIVPFGALIPQVPTLDAETGKYRTHHSVAAIGGDPWCKDIATVIAATRQPDGTPLPDLLSDNVIKNIWDISLVCLMDSHRAGGEYAGDYNFLNILYNLTLRAADEAGMDRMVAAIERRVLLGLRRYGEQWHQLAGIDPAPYATRVPNSNQTTIGTVNLPAWRKLMTEYYPDAAYKLWGYAPEQQGIEVIGLRQKNLYETTSHSPRFSVANLNRLTLPTPSLLMDLDIVAAKYTELAAALPGWNIHYAMKANPGVPILKKLMQLGSQFEIASHGEQEQLQAIGVNPAAILSSNPVKPPTHVASAYAAGVERFAFGSPHELEKIAAHAPGSKVYVRLRTNAGESAVPSEGKFGVRSISQAAELMARAVDLGLQPYGITFHPGSQLERPAAWRRPLHLCRELMEQLGETGIRIDMVDIGGGLPGSHREGLPQLHAYTEVIKEGVAQLPYQPANLVIEPGRWLVDDAGMLITEITSRDETELYTDLGAFVLMEYLQTRTIRYPIADSRWTEQGARTPFNIWAATCDSEDIMARRSHQSADLRPGDRLYIGASGAYTVASASAFNGFPPPAVYYIDGEHNEMIIPAQR
jgi:ornithine decarboxylase